MRLLTVIIAASLVGAVPVVAQTSPASETECRRLAQQLTDHAKVSEGVRRLLAAQPAAPTAAASPNAAPGRAETIRTRLDQLSATRQKLETERLAAVLKWDMSGAATIQGQIQALDREKADLEKELAGLPASPPAATSPAPSAAGPLDCRNVVATRERAIRIRQKELGAREGQAGAIPLVALKGPGVEQVAQELVAQFSPWPASATQVGLLDQDGDGRLDGFVDVAVDGVFRLYRQRSDGSIGVDVFTVAASSGGERYTESARRLEESIVRQLGQRLGDLLARRPAGPVRLLGDTGDFEGMYTTYLAGKLDGRSAGAAARTREFQNFRGDPVRATDLIARASDDGVVVRRAFIVPKGNEQESWEETVIEVRRVSPFQADVETVMNRETRTTAGALVGARSSTTPARFRIER